MAKPPSKLGGEAGRRASCYNPPILHRAMKPSGSIIVVTYNSSAHVEGCLRNLAAIPWERIVVDNASQDDTVALASRIPGTSVLANSENRGFAAAANQGVQAARGELLLLLNPDVLPEPGAVETLGACLAADGAGAAGGRLLNGDGSTQVGFVTRGLPTLATALAEILLLNRVFPRNPINRRYRCLDLDYEQAAEVEQPPGACLLFRRRAWADLGGFDERFFPIWFEDVDFCRRLRTRGWKIVYEPRARFRHLGGRSVATLSTRAYQLYWYQSQLRYFRKHHGRSAVAFLRAGILAGMVLRMAATLLRIGPNNVDPGTVLQAYASVIRFCLFGNPPAAGEVRLSGCAAHRQNT